MRPYTFFIILLLGFSHYASFGQEHKVLAEHHLTKAQKSINLEKTVWRPRLKKSKEKKQADIKPIGALGLGPLLKWIAYLSIINLILLIVYIIFSNVETDNVINKIDETKDTKSIDDIDSIDAHAEYLKAIERGDFRSAIRMQFIITLQYLSKSNKIKWKANKTNREYAHELKSTEFYNNFNQAYSIYEWVWYGQKNINHSEFESLNRVFVSLNTTMT